MAGSEEMGHGAEMVGQSLVSYGVFQKWGYPKLWMVFVRENSIKMDDFGVHPF